MCGVHTKSTTLIKATKSNNDVKLLTKQEIDILAERFEIGGRVHYGHFIQFFKEMINSKSFNRTKSYKAVDGSVQSRSIRPKHSVGLSPFRMSSEWASLKEDVLKNKTYKLNDNSRPLDSVSERGKSTYRDQSSMDIRNSNSKGRINILSEDDDDGNEHPFDQSSPQTPTHNTSSKQNFRERVRDRRDSRSSAGQDEWRASKDRNPGSSSPSDSKYPSKDKNKNNNNDNNQIGERIRSQQKLLNNSDLSDGKKNVPPPKPARNVPGKRNDALVENSPKKNSDKIRQNNRNRDSSDGYYNNKNNSNNNHYDNNSNSNDDDDDDNYNRGISDKKRAVLGSELDFKSDSRGRSGSPRDLRDRDKNNNKNQNQDNDRRRNSYLSDRGIGSERGRSSPSEAKSIPGKERDRERDGNRDKERGSERGRERRSRSPDGRSSPENVAVNRRSWRRSLTDSMMWTKSQTMLVDDDDTSGPLKLPQRAQSPEGKGVTKYFPWNRRSGGDSGRSSPVAL